MEPFGINIADEDMGAHCGLFKGVRFTDAGVRS
jgi:hypothetical protein